MLSIRTRRARGVGVGVIVGVDVSVAVAVAVSVDGGATVDVYIAVEGVIAGVAIVGIWHANRSRKTKPNTIILRG